MKRGDNLRTACCSELRFTLSRSSAIDNLALVNSLVVSRFEVKRSDDGVSLDVVVVVVVVVDSPKSSSCEDNSPDTTENPPSVIPES